MTRSDYKFDRFCLYMIPLCLLGAVVFGLSEFHAELEELAVAVNNKIPGCASGKYACTASYQHGKPFITMALKTLNK